MRKGKNANDAEVPTMRKFCRRLSGSGFTRRIAGSTGKGKPCAKCAEKNGSFQPQAGIKPEFSCGV